MQHQVLILILLAAVACGCARGPFVPHTVPHVYSGGEPAYVSPEQELEEVKREIRKFCFHKHDLDPTMDSPDHDYSRTDENRERCYQLKVRGRSIKRGIKRMRELSEEADVQDQPSPGTIRFGGGPLEHIKPASISASAPR